MMLIFAILELKMLGEKWGRTQQEANPSESLAY